MKPPLHLITFMAAIFISTAFVQPSMAFTPGACKQDEQKFCGDVQPGGGNIRACMEQHNADLSQACKDNIAEGKQKVQERMQAMQAACKQDVQQFCANVTPGEGREIACLKSYSDKISAGCKDQLPKGMMRKGMRTHGQNGSGTANDGSDQGKDGGDQSGTPPPPPDGK